MTTEWQPSGNTAVLSEDGLYRYVLVRTWQPELPIVGTTFTTFVSQPWHAVFCMLNPSDADARRDDPTVRKCYGYASRWGFCGLVIVNEHGYRSPDPPDLKRAHDSGVDIVGPGNDAWVALAFAYAKRTSGQVVAAWGRHRSPVAGREQRIIELAEEHGVELRCIGTNGDGSPKHPLMPSYECDLLPWRPR